MGQSLEVQRHLSEMKWKLSSCEDECVCYLCVSSVMCVATCPGCTSACWGNHKLPLTLKEA